MQKTSHFDVHHVVLCSQSQYRINSKTFSGAKNFHADKLSCRVSPYIWKLHPWLFSFIDQLWGLHMVDRFALDIDKQLPRYNSHLWDPNTEGADALAQQNWGMENNWVNPLFWMIPRILDVICKQEAEATIIAPVWKGQQWYQRLISLATSVPLKLQNSNQTFLQLYAVPEPRKNPKWQLCVRRICGRQH